MNISVVQLRSVSGTKKGAGQFRLIESFDLAAHVINIFAEERCHDGTGEPLAPILTPGIILPG